MRFITKRSWKHFFHIDASADVTSTHQKCFGPSSSSRCGLAGRDHTTITGCTLCTILTVTTTNRNCMSKQKTVMASMGKSRSQWMEGCQCVCVGLWALQNSGSCCGRRDGVSAWLIPLFGPSVTSEEQEMEESHSERDAVLHRAASFYRA